MEMFQGLAFDAFSEADISVYTQIMKRAFDEDARRHTGQPTGGPDGYDDGNFMRKWYLAKGAAPYKAMKDGKPVGAINVFLSADGTGFLGNMFIDPACQDGGLGLILWRYIEQKYPGITVWRTETPGFSRRNHHFYVNKCGFHVIKIEDAKSADGGSYILEKVMPPLEPV